MTSINMLIALMEKANTMQEHMWNVGWIKESLKNNLVKKKCSKKN